MRIFIFPTLLIDKEVKKTRKTTDSVIDISEMRLLQHVVVELSKKIFVYSPIFSIRSSFILQFCPKFKNIVFFLVFWSL